MLESRDRLLAFVFLDDSIIGLMSVIVVQEFRFCTFFVRAFELHCFLIVIKEYMEISS